MLTDASCAGSVAYQRAAIRAQPDACAPLRADRRSKDGVYQRLSALIAESTDCRVVMGTRFPPVLAPE